MLGFFPRPYPDELFYSAAARYQSWVGYDNRQNIVEDLFTSIGISTIYDFPCRLQSFHGQLAHGTMLTPERIIKCNTLYPFYARFMDSTRHEQVISKMIGQGTAFSIRSMIGTNSGIPLLSSLRFCPHCIEEDRNLYGEAYWHRSHQLYGVFVCHKHQIWLMESNVSVSMRVGSRGYECLDGVDLTKSHAVQHGEVTGFDVTLAQWSHWLLNQEEILPAMGFDGLRTRYLHLLADRGLASPNLSVRSQKLVQSFKEYFGCEFLSRLGCDITGNIHKSWLLAAVQRGTKMVQPLRHLLLMKFLDVEPHEFFSNDFSWFNPFGAPPFPCLNPAADHYLQMVINRVEIHRNKQNKRPLGHFHCQCGFTYTRTGPDVCEEDKYKKTRILSKGLLWEKKLRELLNDPQLNDKDIANQLGIAAKSVAEYRKVRTEERKSIMPEIHTLQLPKVTEYRKRLLYVIERNPGESRTKIQKVIAPAEYSWLYCNDRDWLYRNLPSPMIERGGSAKNRFWGKKDEEMVGKVRVAIASIMEYSPKLRRITLTNIAQELRQMSLPHKLNKLPKTQEYIYNHLESLEDFRVRRVKAIASRIRQSGGCLSETQIKRKAGLSRKFSEKVADEITKQIESNYLGCPQRNGRGH